MKLISFTVPCYNSQDYMRHCIDSLLVAGDEAEIIIINDGSKDNTAAIADEYALKYPEIVKVVHKENGGHGTGVNTGLAAAQGLYFKVVDSDDWLNKEALIKFMETIRQHKALNTLPDLYVTNFIYYKADNDYYVSKYDEKLKEGFFDWNKVKAFHYSHTLMMHALTYNTEKLRAHYVELPPHTFYVDNIYAFSPLAYMRTPFYLNVNLYMYFIGRDDQSVNIKNCIARYEQQLLVMKMMSLTYTYRQLKALPRGLSKYMFHYLHAIMMNTLLFACARVEKERKEKVKQMWADIKAHDKKLYRNLRYTNYPLAVAFMPWWMRAKVMMYAYKILCRRIKLGV